MIRALALSSLVALLTFNADALDPGSRATILDECGKGLAGTGRVRVLLHSVAFGNLKPFIADKPDDAVDRKASARLDRDHRHGPVGAGPRQFPEHRSSGQVKPAGLIRGYWCQRARADRWKGTGDEPIGLTNRQHAKALDDIPTASEAGYKSLEFDGLVGLLGPRDFPKTVGDRIAADIREIVADPQIESRLTVTAQVVNPGNAAEFAAALQDQAAFCFR